MSDELDDGQTARTNGSGQSVNIRLVGADRAFWIAVAVVMSLFSFRFNRRFYPFNAFRSLLGIGGEAESPTYRELYDGDWKHPTASGHG